MSRITNISPISNKLWMVITGLAMLYFAVLASGVKRPYSQIQPQAESEKSQALRASIAKLTETRDEALESNEDTRLNLEALQEKYTENAKELKNIKRQINLALIEYDKIMVEGEAPRYISKQWGLLDFRRFEALYKQICDESLHRPCDSEEVETDFNSLVDRLVFGKGWPRQVQANVMNEDAERELDNIAEQWGVEMRALVVDAITELEQYASSHPDLDFGKRDNFVTPYDTASEEIATYEDATKYLSAVVKALVDFTRECICEEEPVPQESEEEEEQQQQQIDASMPHHVDTHHHHHHHCVPDVDWENFNYRSDEERHYDPEDVYYQHHGYV